MHFCVCTPSLLLNTEVPEGLPRLQVDTRAARGLTHAGERSHVLWDASCFPPVGKGSCL